MEETKKSKIYNKIFWKLFLALLFGFGALYISEISGYYEFQQHKQVALTNEKIKEFEQDIKEGKDINIKDYIDEKEIKLDNNFSNAGIFISSVIGDVVQNSLNATIEFFGSVFSG